MGKKKPQKTKEISVAIAEASSSVIDMTQQQGPRKRGRPRKIIVVEMESVCDEKIVSQHEEEEDDEEEEGGGGNKEEHEQACTKQEGVSEEIQVQKGFVLPSKSRARRKSKPRKST